MKVNLQQMERDRQEQQSIIQVSRKHSAQEDEKPSTPSTPNTKEDASS